MLLDQFLGGVLGGDVLLGGECGSVAVKKVTELDQTLRSVPHSMLEMEYSGEHSNVCGPPTKPLSLKTS